MKPIIFLWLKTVFVWTIFGTIMLIFYFFAKAWSPDSTWLTAQSWDVLTAEKWNNLIPSSAVLAVYATTCPAWRKPADGTDSTPDLRWVFLRWLNSFNGGTTTRSDGNQDPEWTSRTVGSYQADQFKSHNHPLIYQRNFAWVAAGTKSWRAANNRAWMWYGSPWFREDSDDMPYRWGTETRGKNVALIFCMKK